MAKQEVKMNSVMSTYIRIIIVVAIATGVMGSTGWGQEIDGRYQDQTMHNVTRLFQNRPM